MLAVGLACGALVAIAADHGSPNTGILNASLPPIDPLFIVFETNSALTALKKSDLLRRFGLMLVNAGGLRAIERLCH